MGWDEIKSEWAARPWTVRFLAGVALLIVLVKLAVEPSWWALVSVFLAILVVRAFWKRSAIVWSVWLLGALVGTVMSLSESLEHPRYLGMAAACLAYAGLLLSRPTQEWTFEPEARQNTDGPS